MSDESVTETVDTPVAETTEDSVPSWVRGQITKANNEAAKYRQRAKDAEDKAQFEAEEKFGSQIKELTDAQAALTAELNNANLAISKLRAALAVGIPGESAAEFAELLQGETDNEIREHAEKVKELMASSSSKKPRFTDPSQGLGGNAVASDPASNFGAFILNNLK
ncbi:hypothetical protein LZ318_11910 [Saccharopolyspora indica]|uniref:hypothetical protein n=1 Tax=Saccharopolyspora indica TaxID=1229659 RepID=UPI0022EAF9EE|nr:hypothetical protein [Saccharopolyspora indica]MDA3643787.1 hypothetical protein [Saccharopolyspora indica]